MKYDLTAAHEATNIHPNWRSLGLAHIRMVRATLRSGRYAIDCKRIIKEAQRDLLSKRRTLAAFSGKL